MVVVGLSVIAVAVAETTPPASAPQDVLIGYFGPASPDHPDGGDLWCAASMALAEANDAGGYQGRPFRLVTSWSASPWGTGVADVARMVYVDKVRAIIGGIDGATTHLAEQVVAKGRLVLMNPVATDKSINMAGVPWMFSSVPLDDAQAAVLAEAIAVDVRTQSFAIVSATDHDSHVFAVELLKALKERELAPTFYFDCAPGASSARSVLERAQRNDPVAVVLVAGASDSAQWVRILREMGYLGDVFGGPWMGRRGFAEQAEAAAEGVRFPYSLTPSAPLCAFTQRYSQRFGRTPDYAAAHMYDTVSLLVAALRRGGLDQTAIRDAVRELSPWPGVAGEIRWNTVGANCRPVHMGTIKDGRAVLVATLSSSVRH